MNSKVVDGIPSDGPWFSASGGPKDKPKLIRARQDLLSHLPAPTLSIRIVLSWNCRAPLDVGFPSERDYSEIESFEETLVAFVEEGAVLAFVVTASGVVEYNFYTSDSDWFVERLNEAFVDKPVVPIEIAAEEDPEWLGYRSLMRAVGLGES